LLTYLSHRPWLEIKPELRRIVRRQVESELRRRYCSRFAVPSIELRYQAADRSILVASISCGWTS
jgi:hypothetical protein